MTHFAGLLVVVWIALITFEPTPAISAVQANTYEPSPDGPNKQGLQPNLVASEPVIEDVRPPPPGEVEDLTEPDPNQPSDSETQPSDEVSIGEIPVVQMVELTLDTAQKAVDAYVIVKDKYKDAALENFDSLQDFVDRDPLGKAFEADIKLAGFANVTDWNLAITTVGAAYSNIIDDQSTDIKQQIEEVEKDTELAQDMKDRIVASLNALIPSENNRSIVQQMIDNPAYTEKLKSLETEEE
jgi:hypothetical protein